MDSVRGPLLEDKVVDFVLELATITDIVVTPEELTKEPETETAPGEPDAAVAS
jgi:trigger factor